MNAKPGEYSGVGDCVLKTLKEGPLAFYKGFQANAGRIVSWNIAMFVSLGQIRKLVHQECYNYWNDHLYIISLEKQRIIFLQPQSKKKLKNKK